MPQIARKLSPEPKARVTNMRSAAFFICSHGQYTSFLSSEAENTTFAIGRRERKWYFRPTRQKELFRNTLAESATFPPCCETGMWYFRPGYGEKQYTHHGNKIGQPTARVCHPLLRLGWQFTRAMDCPSFFLPRCVIYYSSCCSGRKSISGRKSTFPPTAAGGLDKPQKCSIFDSLFYAEKGPFSCMCLKNKDFSPVFHFSPILGQKWIFLTTFTKCA